MYFVKLLVICYFILLIAYIFSTKTRRFLFQGVRFYNNRISASDFRLAIFTNLLLSIFIVGSILLAATIVAYIIDSLPFDFYIIDPWLVIIIIFMLPVTIMLLYIILLAKSAKRRLQDLNINGNLAYLLYAILPIAVVLEKAISAIAAFSPTLLAFGATIIMTIMLAIVKGTPGPNLYGSNVE